MRWAGLLNSITLGTGSLLAFTCLSCEKGNVCSEGCPALGVVEAEGQVTLTIDTETAFGRIDTGTEVVDVGILGGEVVLRSNEAACVASGDHPCAYSIDRLEVRPSGGSFEGRRIDAVRLAIDTPYRVTDSGFGMVVGSGTEVHTCLEVEGRGEHAAGSSTGAATLNYDESVTPKVASLELTWPLAYRFADDDCELTTYTFQLIATAVEAEP